MTFTSGNVKLWKSKIDKFNGNNNFSLLRMKFFLYHIKFKQVILMDRKDA